MSAKSNAAGEPSLQDRSKSDHVAPNPRSLAIDASRWMAFQDSRLTFGVEGDTCCVLEKSFGAVVFVDSRLVSNLGVNYTSALAHCSVSFQCSNHTTPSLRA